MHCDYFAGAASPRGPASPQATPTAETLDARLLSLFLSLFVLRVDAPSMLASLAAHLGAGSGAVAGAAAASQPRRPAAAGAAAAAATTEVSEGEAGLAVLIDSDGSSGASSGGLTAAERAAYDRNGLVVPSAFLSPATAATLQALVERTLAVTCAASPPIEMPIAPNCPTSLYGQHGPPIPEDIAHVWMALVTAVEACV